MKFISPSVEYWEQAPGIDGVWSQIAKATRVCYQSQAREDESNKDFVERVILKPALISHETNNFNPSYDFNKMHGSVLEHGTVYLYIHVFNQFTALIVKRFSHNKYTKVNTINRKNVLDGQDVYITTNIRVILENHLEETLKYIVEPTENHWRRYTFSVITDIGVTREFNRHRVNSIAEQSTRYCSFDKGKFGNEISYTIPAWQENGLKDSYIYTEDSNKIFKTFCDQIALGDNKYWTEFEYYIFSLLAAEFGYMGMRKCNAPNDRARQVLNLNTKTQAVYTAFADDWQHFISLRAGNASGAVHPNMKTVATLIQDKLNQIIKEE